MTEPEKTEGPAPRINRFGDSEPGTIRYTPPDDDEPGDGEASGPAEGQDEDGQDEDGPPERPKDQP